jgi:RimJ/RimL family protein N-acetyltransferase
VIAGQGIQLRRARVQDAEALDRALVGSLEHLRPWMPWVADEPVGLEGRRHLLASWERSWDAGGDAVYLILVDGEIAGTCGLHRRIRSGALEMGYWVAASHVRRGVATEAARLATDAAFTAHGVDRVEIHHDKANAVSGRVPARLGYRLVAEAPRTPRTPAESGVECVWRMEREEWLSSARDRAMPS